MPPALPQPSQERSSQPALPQSIPVPRPGVTLPPVALPSSLAGPRPAPSPGLPMPPPDAGRIPPGTAAEALPLPAAEPPLGNWGDRADVETLSLGSLPWRGGADLARATVWRYGVWVALPSDRHRQLLQQILPLRPAPTGTAHGPWHPAGDFAEPQAAAALARALQQYGFGVQVQRH